MAYTVYTLRDDCPHEVVDALIDNLSNFGGERAEAEKAFTRNEFASIAAGITNDRHSAGSRAAAMTIIVLLKFGWEAAMNFVTDLEHHEG